MADFDSAIDTMGEIASDVAQRLLSLLKERQSEFNLPPFMQVAYVFVNVIAPTKEAAHYQFDDGLLSIARGILPLLRPYTVPNQYEIDIASWITAIENFIALAEHAQAEGQADATGE